MKKIFKLLFSRLFVISVLIGLQIFFLGAVIYWLKDRSFYVYLFLQLLSLGIVLTIVSKPNNPMYKIAWIIPIMMVPLFGGFFYLIFGRRISDKRLKRIRELQEKSHHLYQDGSTPVVSIPDPVAQKQSSYITKTLGYPLYANTQTMFLSPGEDKFQVLCEELKKAKRFVFLEYFIVEKGRMWDSIREILVERAAAGVEVRLIYDDMGTIQLLPPNYPEELEKAGIRTRVFNPFRPSLDAFLNCRDHRKICVIDGHTGITGGINLADEYINAYEKHGYWKDSAVLLRGDGVWSLTMMFLQMWEGLSKAGEDFTLFRPTEKFEARGYVQPFGDTPVDRELGSESVYMNLINHAQRTVKIETPYLIVDNEMTTALMLAAKNGVKVTIVTPRVGDKWFVHETTRGSYGQLLESGVEIYEYTPGFIHAKVIVADDEAAVVGTANFDFRSFYLHFECGVWMYQTDALGRVVQDFDEIIQVSQKVTLQDCVVPWYRRAVRAVLRVFAPLM